MVIAFPAIQNVVAGAAAKRVAFAAADDGVVTATSLNVVVAGLQPGDDVVVFGSGNPNIMLGMVLLP